jgi:putative zinc finger/helix-turn-helix YgiT family protein
MTEPSNLIEFPQPERIECPTCGGHNVHTTIETETFAYGDGPEAVGLTVRVPVRTCNNCGFQFTDDIAEEVRHEAVCRHLGMMSPKEIQRIRKTYGMSRADFARLTRIGEASLARWESGQLIQSPAYDRFLYLLNFPENLERLKSRKPDEQPLSSRPHRRGAGLRALQLTEQEFAAADAFELIRTGT